MLQKRIDELIDQHGGLRKAARAIGVDHVYLWRLYRGTKNNPSNDILQKLNLKRITSIEACTEMTHETRRFNSHIHGTPCVVVVCSDGTLELRGINGRPSPTLSAAYKTADLIERSRLRAEADRL